MIDEKSPISTMVLQLVKPSLSKSKIRRQLREVLPSDSKIVVTANKVHVGLVAADVDEHTVLDNIRSQKLSVEWSDSTHLEFEESHEASCLKQFSPDSVGLTMKALIWEEYVLQRTKPICLNGRVLP